MVIWTPFADRRIRRTFFLLIIYTWCQYHVIKVDKENMGTDKVRTILKRFCCIIFEKWVAKLPGFAIINAWQYFGSRKSASYNK